uniref:Ig-like domain-containing protein n=1 Tax=Dicentrarchus labrax TaxID=13489 RepID=A0A8C4ICM3_DICLA
MGTMFLFDIFLVVFFINFLHDFHVNASGCDENCAEKPVFSPSRLVVKFGDPSSTMCTVCEQCTTAFGLVSSSGENTENGTTITWQADSVTEWELPLLCYYEKYINDPNQEFDQCCTPLHVTVYKPPDNVSISFVNHTGPMYEGRQYTLQCTVQDVAPVENLTVTFYRGQTVLGQLQSNYHTRRKPMTEIFTLNISPSKYDDGVQYWCEAKLELGPEGPQPPSVVKSQNITAAVYYKPQLQVSSPPELITVLEGDSLKLDCSAVGNPSPSYSWTLPSNSQPPSTDSVLTINSTTSEDKGLYSCYVSNKEGYLTLEFNVNVKVSYIGYFILLGVIVVAVIVIIMVLLYIHYHRKYRMGQYNLKDVFRLHARHSAVPITE